MRLTVRILNSDLSPDEVRTIVDVMGSLQFDLSAEEAAAQLKDAWQRVVVPVQNRCKETKTLETDDGDFASEQTRKALLHNLSEFIRWTIANIDHAPREALQALPAVSDLLLRETREP